MSYSTGGDRKRFLKCAFMLSLSLGIIGCLADEESVCG